MRVVHLAVPGPWSDQAVVSRQLCSTQVAQLHVLPGVCAACVQALIHGLNRHYYSIGINYRCARVLQA